MPDPAVWARPQVADDLARLLETDIPEMIAAVREANAERDEARLALAQRAGTKYAVTITSDSPMRVRKSVPEE